MLFFPIVASVAGRIGGADIGSTFTFLCLSFLFNATRIEHLVVRCVPPSALVRFIVHDVVYEQV